MSRDLIIGNWKMHASHLDAIQMVQKLSYRLESSDYERVEVVVAPPTTALRSVQTVIEADRLSVKLGAQNVHWEEKGAFTGEVSPEMLAKLSVSYVIVGHSERRAMFGETDDTVNKKVTAVLAREMTPVVCVGESLEQRQAGEADEWVAGQVEGAIKGLSEEQKSALVIAYEPIWAIGTGQTATPDDADSMAKTIREALGAGADTIPVLYGGSVNPGNIAGFMAKLGVNGALVGGAALDPDTFAMVVRYWA